MITPFKADLHIHTALSPCAEREMTPAKIVHAARAKGLQLIAVTDHNTCMNALAVMEAARGSGITVLPGMEVQTREEVHMVCLFPEIDAAHAWQDLVYASLPAQKNKPGVFGEQLIMDPGGEIVGEEERLLLTSTSFSVEKAAAGVADLGGFCLPAHVDRPSFSLLASLGFIPPGLPIPAVEISRHIYAEETVYLFPALQKISLVNNSDAHSLPDLGARSTTFYLERPPSLAEMLLACSGQSGRKVVPQVKELSMHILDIIQNSIAAGAGNIELVITEDTTGDHFLMLIADDGRGMSPEMLDKVTDPFFTTRTTRKVGLGLPLLKAAAERCDGEFTIISTPEKGAKVTAQFRHSHIDRAPLGNMTETVITILAGEPGINFNYIHTVNGETLVFDSAELRRELEDIPLNNPAILNWVRNYLAEGYQRLYGTK